MSLTLRRLNRATLARQLPLRREPLPVVDAVRRIVAVQALEPPSPYAALWNRVAGFDPADLDAAFATTPWPAAGPPTAASGAGGPTSPAPSAATSRRPGATLD